MKKIALLFFVIVSVIFACTPKALPTIPDREREVPVKETAKTDIKADAALGKTIYTNRCARCHDLPDPTQFTFQRWEGILKSMIPKARLNEEQSVHLTAYVKENAK